MSHLGRSVGSFRVLDVRRVVHDLPVWLLHVSHPTPAFGGVDAWLRSHLDRVDSDAAVDLAR